MKVWVVVQKGESSPCGAFSSLEAAKAFAERMNSGQFWAYTYIVECDVDGEVGDETEWPERPDR